MKIAHSVEKGARDTKAGASAFKDIPGLYELANKKAPAELEELGAEIAMGTKDAADENKTLGGYTTKLRQYTKKPAK